MIRIAILGMALLALTSSCESKKELADISVEPSPPDTVVVVMQASEPEDSLAVYFEKTPCFGRCPVYKVHIYESGFATYEGLNFAELMGLYAHRFSNQELQDILRMAEEIDYFALEEEYDDPRISDLPTTISKIRLNGKEHQVKARSGIPKYLKDFHENLGVFLREQDWEPYSLR
jgi:hypothetical protein